MEDTEAPITIGAIIRSECGRSPRSYLRDLALQVLAAKSGGHGELPVINGDSAVSDVLNHFVSEASTFYSLSFDSPRARKADEFHELKVKVDRRGLKAHTITGYYDEPEYFRPEPKKEKEGGREAACR